jgi:hypothetical protein
LQTAAGQARTLRVPDLPDPRELTGAWTVQFDSGHGEPGSLVWDSLVDWTQHADPMVKYYSGTATYRKQFEVPTAFAGRRLFLDLGEVHDLAAIRVNGRDVGIVWIAPWQIEITDAAGPAQNVLEIDVVNAWNNRLVGDAALPPEQRSTFLTAPTVKANSPLLPAGLLGPVTLRAASEVRD